MISTPSHLILILRNGDGSSNKTSSDGSGARCRSHLLGEGGEAADGWRKNCSKNTQTLSWGGCFQKSLPSTTSQLMIAEGLNDINSLRLTAPWGCKSSGMSFHFHLPGCSSERRR